MSRRAAWQLEWLGCADVYDFVAGKAYWMASGRATERRDGPRRVGEVMRPVGLTASPDDAVHDLLARDITGDLVVVGRAGVVVGRVTVAALAAAEPGALVGDVMRPGPTTVRPDEPVAALERRMADRAVRSMLVTAPTGVLLGVFEPE